jgi:hypothetical protein
MGPLFSAMGNTIATKAIYETICYINLTRLSCPPIKPRPISSGKPNRNYFRYRSFNNDKILKYFEVTLKIVESEYTVELYRLNIENILLNIIGLGSYLTELYIRKVIPNETYTIEKIQEILKKMYEKLNEINKFQNEKGGLYNISEKTILAELIKESPPDNITGIDEYMPKLFKLFINDSLKYMKREKVEYLSNRNKNIVVDEIYRYTKKMDDFKKINKINIIKTIDCLLMLSSIIVKGYEKKFIPCENMPIEQINDIIEKISDKLNIINEYITNNASKNEKNKITIYLISTNYDIVNNIKDLLSKLKEIMKKKNNNSN